MRQPGDTLDDYYRKTAPAAWRAGAFLAASTVVGAALPVAAVEVKKYLGYDFFNLNLIDVSTLAVGSAAMVYAVALKCGKKITASHVLCNEFATSSALCLSMGGVAASAAWCALAPETQPLMRDALSASAASKAVMATGAGALAGLAAFTGFAARRSVRSMREIAYHYMPSG